MLAVQSSMGWAGAAVVGFFYGQLTDIIGRKQAIMLTCVVIILSSILQAVAQNNAMLIVSRLILGMGNGAAYICGPTYLAETLPFKWRAFALGIYMDLYYVGKGPVILHPLDALLTCKGGLLSAGVTYGAFKLNSTWSWRLPCALQGVFTVMALAVIPLVPESPRWLVARDRREEALQVIALTHSEGDVEDPVTLAVYKEITDTLEYEKVRGKGISYIDAIRSRSALRRIALMVSVAVITMLSGMQEYSFISSRSADCLQETTSSPSTWGSCSGMRALRTPTHSCKLYVGQPAT